MTPTDPSTCAHPEADQVGLGSVQSFTRDGRRQRYLAVLWCRRCGAHALVSETRSSKVKRSEWVLPGQAQAVAS